MFKKGIQTIGLLLVLVIGAISTLPVQAASTYSISGTILINGVGLKGVTVTVKGTLFKAVTDSAGNYSIHLVPAGSSGSVVPTMTYFSFSPTSIAFTNLTATLTGKNFTATLIKPVFFTISGKILTNANLPLPGVVVSIGTFTATTSSTGTYTITGVPILTKGRIVPKLAGYAFTPAYIVVSQLLSNLTNENFTAFPVFTISGKITDKATGLPLGGVTVTYGTFKAVSSTTTGAYTIRNIPAGTSGVVVPSLTGKTFTPINITINNLQTNMHSQNFVAAP